MSTPLKARVLRGRYQGEIVRVTNVSQDELGRKSAACFLSNGTRANIKAEDLEVIPPEPEKEILKPKNVSMPFVSGSSSSRTLTHTKNMGKNRIDKRAHIPSGKVTMVKCEKCQNDFNQEERKNQPGKITECENCAEETETKMEGTMIFSHKTGATIEIKKDGELKQEAETFNYKNKD
jgi:hypothetical protein